MTFIIIAGCLAFVALGIIIGYNWPKKVKTVGTLRIDTSDPYDGPYLFLEMNTSVDYLMSKETVQLCVNTENYLSQN